MGHRNLSPALGGGGERNEKKEKDDGREGGVPLQHKKERKTDTGNAVSGRRDGRKIDF